jgi:phosphatidylglycerophosphate synthase
MTYSLKHVVKSFRGASSIREVIYQNLASQYLVYWLANFTKFRPEQINFLSLITGLTSAFLYGTGPQYYIPAVFFHEISYILDASDGKLARLKNQVTSFGEKLDGFRDKSVHIFSLIGLLYGAYAINPNNWLILIGLLYACLMLINNFLAFSLEKKLSPTQITRFSFISSQSLTGRLARIRLGNRNIIPMPTVAEWLFIIFVLGPLLDQILICLAIACTLVLTSISFFLYKLVTIKNQHLDT